jgi:hypothetical protein
LEFRLEAKRATGMHQACQPRGPGFAKESGRAARSSCVLKGASARVARYGCTLNAPTSHRFGSDPSTRRIAPHRIQIAHVPGRRAAARPVEVVGDRVVAGRRGHALGLQTEGRASCVERAPIWLSEWRPIPQSRSIGGPSRSNSEEQGVTWDEHIPKPTLVSTKPERIATSRNASNRCKSDASCRNGIAAVFRAPHTQLLRSRRGGRSGCVVHINETCDERQ